MSTALPYAVEHDEQGQERKADRSLELAVVLSHIEAKREKGGGFPIKKPPEELHYVTKVMWPLFLLKRQDKDKHIVFDTVGLFAQTFSYDTIPLCKDFGSQISSLDPERTEVDNFIAFLKTHQETFKDFVGSIHSTMHGCLAHEGLMRDLVSSAEAGSDQDLSESVILGSQISLEQVKRTVDELVNLKNRAMQDIEDLQSAIATLSRSSDAWLASLTQRQTAITDRYNSQIEQIRPQVVSRTTEYQSRMNMEIQSVELRLFPTISTLQAEISRWQLEEDRYRQMGKGFEKARDSASKAKDVAKKQLTKLESDRAYEISSVRSHYSKLIEQECNRIRSLEEERDRQVKELEDKKTEIATYSSDIVGKVGNLVQRKHAFIGAMDEVGLEIPETLKAKAPTESFTLHVPLCVAKLQGKKTRYLVVPPIRILKSKKLLDKFKGILGALTLPIESRTERFETIVKKRFEEALATDKLLEMEVSEKAKPKNYLAMPHIREHFFQGLARLKESGLLKDKHFAELKASFEKHFKSAAK